VVVKLRQGVVIKSLQGSEDWGIRACSHRSEELSGFDHCNGFVFQVLVVGGDLLDYSFHYIWGLLHSHIGTAVGLSNAPCCKVFV
jgi:hypothetical protein